MRSITESANKVKTLVDEVKLGSEEQARGIEQVAKAITQMEKVTQTTAANAEESASASEELSAQSDTLRAIVARLNGMVGGGSGPGTEHAEPGIGRGVSRSLADGPRSHRRTVPSAATHAASAAQINREPVLAKAHSDKNAFPMEEDFKEF